MSEDTIKGPIKYDFENDIVQINNNGHLQAYSARKVVFFEIFDESHSDYRQFFALPYKVKPDYMVPIFFEVLEEGKLTLLSRETVVQESVPQYDYYSRGTTHQMIRYKLVYDYFFLDKKGEIKKYDLKRRHLYSFMKPYSGEIKSFIKENKLKYDKRDDLRSITAYYNGLFEKK